MGSIWGPKIEVPLSFKLQKIDVWNFHHWLPPTKYFHVQGHLKVKSRSEANFFKTLDRDVGFQFLHIQDKPKVIARSKLLFSLFLP